MNVFIDIDIDIDIFKIDLIDIDIFKTRRYIDNRYGLSIYRTPLVAVEMLYYQAIIVIEAYFLVPIPLAKYATVK